MVTTTLLTNTPSPDQTTDIAIWSTIEVGVGITTLSVAALHPLVTQWRCRRGLLPIATAAACPSGDTPLAPRNHYMRAHSNDPPRHHRPGRRSGRPLRLRPDDTILYISSASGPSSSSPPPPLPPRAPSRFALSHWIEEGLGGHHDDGSSNGYYHQHSREGNEAGSTTELADWHGGGSGGGITKTTKVSQRSQHRLSRIDAVLLSKEKHPSG